MPTKRYIPRILGGVLVLNGNTVSLTDTTLTPSDSFASKETFVPTDTSSISDTLHITPLGIDALNVSESLSASISHRETASVFSFEQTAWAHTASFSDQMPSFYWSMRVPGGPLRNYTTEYATRALFNLIDAPIDVLTPLDSLATAGQGTSSFTDNLTVNDSVISALSHTEPADQLTTSEVFSTTPPANFYEQLTTSENSAYAVTATFSEQINLIEVDAVTDSLSLPSDTVTTSDNLTFNNPFFVFVDQLTENETLSTALSAPYSSSDAISEAYNVTGIQVPIDELTPSDDLSTSNTAAPVTYPLLAFDNFNRVDQSGFGTATDSISVWTPLSGKATYAISNDTGVATMGAINDTSLLALNQTATGQTWEVLMDWQTNYTGSPNNHIGVFFDYENATNYMYFEATSGNINLHRIVNGNDSIIATKSGNTIAANTQYHMRVRWTADGHYFCKVWTATASEPAAWNINGQADTTFNAGQYGLWTASRGAGSTVTLSQFYVHPPDFNDDTLTGGLLSVENFVPTLSPATTDSVTETENASYVTIEVPIEIITETEQIALALSASTEDDSLVLDISTETSINSALDSVSTQEIAVFGPNPAPFDQVTEQEASAYALAASYEDDNLVQDGAAPTRTYAFVDSLATTDALASALNAATTAIVAAIESVASTSYFTPEEDLEASEATILVGITVVPTDAGTLAETKLFAFAQTYPADSVVPVDASTSIGIINNVTTIGTASDSIAYGQPSTLIADTLTITDSIQPAEVRPLVDDALQTQDYFGIIDNFTDLNTLTENFVIAQSNTLLDAHASLYSNIIIDNPSTYYKLNERTFNGIFQRDGSDQPNNASVPSLYGATLEYTWTQLEPDETDYQFPTIDTDILPWQQQNKQVIIRVITASTPFYNSTHNANTAGQATPQWVFDAGAASITGHDGAVYPVYWDPTYLQKYQNFVTALANYYDENSNVAAVVISCGVNGTTSLEASGDTTTNTTLLWTPVGYTPAQWTTAMQGAISIYQSAFQHTPLILSVNSAFIAPDSIYNIHQCISLALANGVWLMDENVSVSELHNDPSWTVAPLIIVPQYSVASGKNTDTLAAELALATTYQATYSAVWAADITKANQSTITTYANTALARTLNDSATNGLQLSVYGNMNPTARIVTGDYYNGAQQADGLTGYAYATDTAQTTTSAWTLKASIYPSLLPMEEAVIFCIGQDGTTAYGGYALGVSGGSNGGIGAKFCVHLPGIGWLDSGYALPQAGQWYSLFATWNGTTLSFYVNGVQTANSYSITAYTPEPVITIGAQWDGMTRAAKRFFTGSIDECASYPVALSASRILALSQLEVGMAETLLGGENEMAAVEQLTLVENAVAFTVSPAFVEVLTETEIFASSVSNTNYNAWTQLADDLFNRTVVSGLGTATDGNVWQVKSGSASLSVSSGAGSATGATGANVLFLGASSGYEDITVKFQVSATGSTFGLVARGADSNNYYSLRIGATLQLYKTALGSDTTLGSGAAFTVNAGTWYHLHLRVAGSTLYGNIWVDGSAEPLGWQVSATDAAFTSGYTGLYINLSSGATVVSFSNFYALDNLLSDFVLLQESYALTAIPAPFVDSIVLIENYVTIEVPSIVESTGALILSGIESIYQQSITRDFVLPGIDSQFWQMSDSLVDQATASDVLLVPENITIPTDVAPPLSDLITPTNIPSPVDAVPAIETLYEALSVVLPDPSTLIDASTTTIRRSIVDSDISPELSDLAVPTGIMLEVSQLSIVDNIGHGPAYLFTEVTLSIDASTINLNNLTQDVTAPSSDIVIPTDIWALEDDIVDVDTVLFTNGPVLPADVTGANPEEDVAVLLVTLFNDTSSLNDVSLTNNTFLLLDPAMLLLESNTVTGSYIPQSVTSNTEVDGTFESVTFPADTSVPSDSVTPIDLPMLLDTSVPSDNVTQSVSLFLLADTPNVTESLLSVSAESNIIVTLSANDILSNIVNPVESNAFTEQEAYLLPLAEVLADSVSTNEITLSGVMQAATDSVDIAEQTIATNDIFDGADLNVFDEEVLDQEFDYNTDSTVNSDSILVIETYLHLLDDQAVIPSDALQLASTSAFVEQLETTDALNDYVVVQLADVPAPVSDAISDLQANTFTAWVDILDNTEIINFVVEDITTESQSELESAFFFESAIYQDYSTPLTEINALTVAQASTDNSLLSGNDTTSVTLPVTEQLTQADTSVTRGVTLESNSLTIDDTVATVTGYIPEETMLQVDASKVTCNVSEGVTLLLSESNTVTGDVTESSVTPVDERVTPAEIVTLDGTPLSNNDTSFFVTLSIPIDGTPASESVTFSMVQIVDDTSVLNDVSSTTSVTLDSTALQESETTFYVTGLAPLELIQNREVLLATEVTSFVDSTMSEQEVLAVGYTLTDTLSIVEVIAITRKSYIKTQGIIRTGQADGIIRTGTVTGTTRTGLVDGVLP